MKLYLLCVLVLLCAVLYCQAKPDGAPESACSSLTPAHPGFSPQLRIPPPYIVSAVKSGNKVIVNITSPIGEEFQGFVLQARSANDKTKFIDGEFTDNAETRATDCFKGTKNTLTQRSPSPKKFVVTEWTPKNDVNEDVVFRATVAKTFAEFWVGIDSPPIKIGDVMVESSKTSNPPSIYEECFQSRGCFGLPSGCVQRGDCEVLLTYARTPNGVQFELNGYLDSSMYMAMGLSNDGVMGEDSVTECIREDSSVIARESWNEGKSNTRTIELSQSSYSSSFMNGLSTCTWMKPDVFQANGKHFDLANNNYYILLAKGDVAGGSLKYHHGRIPSSGAVNFTAFESMEGEGVATSVKVHGAFMVTAWVGFVSFAILLARHFKNTWEDSTLGGVKIWFALHRAFMISGLLFVIVAFIVIFIHKNGWNYNTKNPHAILGCIATALGLFNPIMAICRCAPDHPKRPIFNWLHWAVGNSAQIVAIITIFFAVSLQSSGLDKRFYWVMAVFVILHLIFHLLYQVRAWTQGQKKSNDFSLNNMNNARSYTIQNEPPSQTKDTSVNEFRIFLLSIYTAFVLTILIALYSLIGVA